VEIVSQVTLRAIGVATPPAVSCPAEPVSVITIKVSGLGKDRPSVSGSVDMMTLLVCAYDCLEDETSTPENPLLKRTRCNPHLLTRFEDRYSSFRISIENKTKGTSTSPRRILVTCFPPSQSALSLNHLQYRLQTSQNAFLSFDRGFVVAIRYKNSLRVNRRASLPCIH